jgi:hypothetical protein
MSPIYRSATNTRLHRSLPVVAGLAHGVAGVIVSAAMRKSPAVAN